jgi:hypothetical protein
METVTLGTFKTTYSEYGGSQPWAIAFCYPASGPVVVKGMSKQVYDYVNTLPPATVCYTHWKHGKSCGYWSLNQAAFQEGWYLRSMTCGGRKKYTLGNVRLGVMKIMRRMPRKVLAELSHRNKE